MEYENTYDREEVASTLGFWRQTAPQRKSGRDFFTIICVFTIKIEEIMIPSAQEQGEAISSAREQGVAKLFSLATQNEIVMPSAQEQGEAILSAREQGVAKLGKTTPRHKDPTSEQVLVLRMATAATTTTTRRRRRRRRTRLRAGLPAPHLCSPRNMTPYIMAASNTAS